VENLAIFVLLGALAAIALGLGLSLRRDRLGRTAHSHHDGVPHVHWHGDKAHSHPTVVEKYDGLLTRLLGPAPQR